MNFLALKASVFDCLGALCSLWLSHVHLFLAPTFQRTLWPCYPDLSLTGDLFIWARLWKPRSVWGWSLQLVLYLCRQESLCESLLIVLLHKQMFHIVEGRNQGEEPVTRSCLAKMKTKAPLSLCNNLTQEELRPELWGPHFSSKQAFELNRKEWGFICLASVLSQDFWLASASPVKFISTLGNLSFFSVQEFFS